MSQQVKPTSQILTEASSVISEAPPINKLQEQVTLLNSTLTTKNQQIESLKQQLNQANSAYSIVANQKSTLQNQLQQKNAQLLLKNCQISSQTTEITNLKDQVINKSTEIAALTLQLTNKTAQLNGKNQEIIQLSTDKNKQTQYKQKALQEINELNEKSLQDKINFQNQLNILSENRKSQETTLKQTLSKIIKSIQNISGDLFKENKEQYFESKIKQKTQPIFLKLRAFTDILSKQYPEVRQSLYTLEEKSKSMFIQYSHNKLNQHQLKQDFNQMIKTAQCFVNKQKQVRLKLTKIQTFQTKKDNNQVLLKIQNLNKNIHQMKTQITILKLKNSNYRQLNAQLQKNQKAQLQKINLLEKHIKQSQTEVKSLKQIQNKNQKINTELIKVCRQVYTKLRETLFNIRNNFDEQEFTSFTSDVSIVNFVEENPSTLTKLSIQIADEFETISTTRKNKIIEKTKIIENLISIFKQENIQDALNQNDKEELNQNAIQNENQTSFHLKKILQRAQCLSNQVKTFLTSRKSEINSSELCSEENMFIPKDQINTSKISLENLSNIDEMTSTYIDMFLEYFNMIKDQFEALVRRKDEHTEILKKKMIQVNHQCDTVKKQLRQSSIHINKLENNMKILNKVKQSFKLLQFEHISRPYTVNGVEDQNEPFSSQSPSSGSKGYKRMDIKNLERQKSKKLLQQGLKKQQQKINA